MKRIIISMLSVLIIFSCVGCSNTNQPVEEVPEAKQEIVETDDVFIKELKNTHNQIVEFWNSDMGIVEYSETPDGESDSYIVRDKNRELLCDSSLDYLCVYDNGKNYIYTDDNVFLEVDSSLPRHTESIYNRYVTLMNWIIEEPDKYEFKKVVNDDATVTYSYITTDYEYYIDKYNKTFSSLEILSVFDKAFELAITVDAEGNLTQIDWFATNSEENIQINIATMFTKDLASVYKKMGNNVQKIWEYIPK